MKNDVGNNQEHKSPVARLTLTHEEACAVLGISAVTLYRLEKRGLIRPIKGIRHKLYARAEVDRFIVDQTKSA